MERIEITSDIATKLFGAAAAELVDPQGQVVGFFTRRQPSDNLTAGSISSAEMAQLYRDTATPYSEEELDSRARSFEGRTLSEIRTDLESDR